MGKKLQLKQENKKHKKEGGHSSKRQKVRDEKGRTNGSQTSTERSRSKKEESRHEKANKKIQQRRNKVESTLLNNRVRLLAPMGQRDRQVVAVISLNVVSNVFSFLDTLKKGGGKETVCETTSASTGAMQLEFSDCKSSSSFLFLWGNAATANTAVDPVMLSLDLVRAADMVVFCVGVADESVSGHSDAKKSDPIDAVGQRTLTALRALGFPSQTFIFSHYIQQELPMSAVSQPHLHQRSLQMQLQEAGRLVRTVAGLGENTKLLDSLKAAQQTARCLWEASNAAADAGPVWRSSRSYLVSLQLSVSQDDAAGGKESIVVEGFLKGRPLAVNSLVHVLGAGVARIKSISSSVGGGVCVVADPSKQESLDFAAVGDDLKGEQTWPSEAEMQEADSHAQLDLTRRQPPSSVPKGMSSYQADWFTDEQGKFDDGDEGEEGGVEEEEGGGDMEEDQEEEGDAPATESRDRQADKQRQREEERKRMLNDDMAFPDEVDTPEDVSARVRFARFRALQSFKNSTWHPKENLPQEYCRIFHLQNFTLVQKRLQEQGRLVDLSQQQHRLKAKKEKKKESQSVRGRSRSSAAAGGSVIGDGDDHHMDEDDVDVEVYNNDNEKDGMEEEGGGIGVSGENSLTKQQLTFTVPGHPDYVQSGQYIRLELECVSSAPFLSRMQEYGHVSVFSLLPHENQMSVLHFNCQRVLRGQVNCAVNDAVIKSKDTILVQMGFRSFLTRPIFSEANLNCDKHKFSRFLQHDTFSVGSCFGPMTLTPCPVLLFAQPDGDTGGWQLIATGTMAYADPDRIILKKIVLSGIPIRVRKKYAVVKHMFRETQDVRWFKPAELCTKHGLRGNITEPIGLHGLFKARFSAPITQNDTVLLVLYKRVYPKMPIDRSSEVAADKICDVIVR